ncbi:MAG: hypothetical protein AAGE52_09565 [Myxococcota bacterium]
MNHPKRQSRLTIRAAEVDSRDPHLHSLPALEGTGRVTLTVHGGCALLKVRGGSTDACFVEGNRLTIDFTASTPGDIVFEVTTQTQAAYDLDARAA